VQLVLPHAGFSDKQGAIILNALVDSTNAACKILSRPVVSPEQPEPDGSISDDGSDGGCGIAATWTLADLRHNSLEGGSALCAAALAANLVAASAAATSAAAGPDSQAGGLLLAHGSRRLLLDGNPLVRPIMRGQLSDAELVMTFASHKPAAPLPPPGVFSRALLACAS
jgi:hypothetical protein